MRPPSFDEFIRDEQTGLNGSAEDAKEPFTLERCPTPDCTAGRLHPVWDHGLIAGFKCAKGCVFSAHRNIFTLDITYYKLEEFDATQFRNPEDIHGMKFTPLGEPYTDWY